MSFPEIAQELPKLSPALLLIGILVGLFLYKHLDKQHKTIFLYLLAMLIIDFASRYLMYRYENNQIILLVYSLTELVLFSYMYLRLLLRKYIKVLILLSLLGALYIIGEILLYFVFNTTDALSFQPYAKVADNFVVIILALTFLYEKMNEFKESKWDNFRLNIVILVFFTLNTLIFLPFNFLVNEKSGIKFYFWTGNIILLLLFYGFLISEIWRNGRIRK
ncbi:hypothetical protein GWA97_05020 [Flavobacterium sp. LaA7.5]|nr:hypothetical protein [Flavobacterium salilacus subsp. altitudinum]